MVQHMRRMREDGDLGDILVVQGTYSQDWLLYDTDWNWRLESKHGGPSRCLADIGSHWCDMAEHVTGQRITSVCAESQTFHKTRKQPKGPIETFAGKTLRPEDYIETPIDTEDFGAWCSAWAIARAARSPQARCRPAARTACNIEIYGTKCGVAWNQERPDELWIGHRNTPNQIIIKDPSLLKPRRASPTPICPAATAKATTIPSSRCSAASTNRLQDPAPTPEYPQFADGLRQLTILEAEMASNEKRAWVDVPA